MVNVQKRLAELRGLPKSVTVDNGSGFAGKELDEWAYSKGLHLSGNQSGKQQSTYFESFNGMFRYGFHNFSVAYC